MFNTFEGVSGAINPIVHDVDVSATQKAQSNGQRLEKSIGAICWKPCWSDIRIGAWHESQTARTMNFMNKIA